MGKIADLKDLEQEVIHSHFLSGALLGQPDRIDEYCIRAILKQRRFVTYEFMAMCEYFDVTLEDVQSRQVLSGIAAEEFGLRPGEPWPNLPQSHRRAYIDELDEIGVGRDEALTEIPSHCTMRTSMNLRRYVFELGGRAELEQLAYLRFAGEVLTGLEYRLLFERLTGLGLLTKERSKFLHPHIDYDVLALDGGTSHADRYLPILEERLVTRGDWQCVGRVFKKAARLRREFYDQFDYA